MVSCCRSMYQTFKTAAEEALNLEELRAEATTPPEKEMSPADAEGDLNLEEEVRAEATPPPEKEMQQADAEEEVELEELKAEVTPPPEKEMTPADAANGSAQ